MRQDPLLPSTHNPTSWLWFWWPPPLALLRWRRGQRTPDPSQAWTRLALALLQRSKRVKKFRRKIKGRTQLHELDSYWWKRLCHGSMTWRISIHLALHPTSIQPSIHPSREKEKKISHEIEPTQLHRTPPPSLSRDLAPLSPTNPSPSPPPPPTPAYFGELRRRKALPPSSPSSTPPYPPSRIGAPALHRPPC